MKNTPLITILGPTASGKTKIACEIAHALKGEILSADSRQVYRKLNIGSGKDLSEFTIQDQQIPYHLIDIVDLEQEYSIFDYQDDFYNAYSKIVNREVQPILVGGSGLYLETILGNYHLLKVPENPTLRGQLEGLEMGELQERLKSLKPQHNETDLLEKPRLIRAIEIADYEANNHHLKPNYPKVTPVIFGLEVSRENLIKKIDARLQARLKNGMLDEVKDLLNSGVNKERLFQLGLEYKFTCQYLIGKMDYDTMQAKLFQAICKFAKRQRTWFRRMEKRGFQIHWIDPEQAKAKIMAELTALGV